jgi:hypothetical protein
MGRRGLKSGVRDFFIFGHWQMARAGVSLL